MPNTTGWLSRLRGRPEIAAAAPTPQAVVNAKNNVNTKALSNALTNYVKSIRTLRNANPFGLSRNVLINSTATNRNKVNRAIANYVMNVNKARYLNTAASQVIPLAQMGAVPEPIASPVVNAAARQNNKTALAAQQVQQAAPPPLPPKPVKMNTANAENMAYLNSLGNMLNTNTIKKVQKIYNEPFSSNAVKKKALEVLNRLKKPNERVNLLKTLTNLNTNAKVNAAIKEIRGRNPNANWANVKTNGLTNGQKKVLNGLKMGKNYVGLVRQKTPNMTGNFGTANLFKQAQAQRPAPPPPPPSPPSKPPPRGINFNELKRRVAQRQARVAAAPKN
jgi:hypothetical protein